MRKRFNMAKVYAATSWRLSKDQPVYYKPPKGKRIIVARIAAGLSDGTESAVRITIVEALKKVFDNAEATGQRIKARFSNLQSG